MNLSDEGVHHLIEQMAAAMMRQDSVAVTSFFADDAVMLAPGGKFVGKQAIFDAGDHFNQDYNNIVIVVKEVIYRDLKGVIEWSFAETRKRDGWTHVMEDAIIFHLRADGKVIYWREYFDPNQIELL